jgi:hypothetical protein
MKDVMIHLQHYRREAGITLRELESQARCPRSTLNSLEHEVGYLAEACAIVARISTAINTSPWLWVHYTDWPVPVQTCACQDATRKKGP